MEVFLVRHTALDIAPGVCYGQSDIDVAATFDVELEVVKQELSGYGDLSGTLCYSSPLQRCWKLAERLGCRQVQIDDRLKEMNFGEWELRKWDDIERKKLDEWGDDFVNVNCPGGESYHQLHKRVISFLEELKEKSEQKVVIVTHGGVIRSALSYFEESSLELSFERKIPYGGVFVV